MKSRTLRNWLSLRRGIFWIWAPASLMLSVLALWLWPGLSFRIGFPRSSESSMRAGIIRESGWPGRRLLMRLAIVEFHFREIKERRKYDGWKCGFLWVDFGHSIWILGQSFPGSSGQIFPVGIGWESQHYIIEIRSLSY